MSKYPNMKRIQEINKAINEGMRNAAEGEPIPARDMAIYTGIIVSELMELNQTMAFIADFLLEREKNKGRENE